MVLHGATLQYLNVTDLVIDAGTCVTYDFIDQRIIIWAISPGLRFTL
jgi:type III pantothenate kinase